MVFPISNMEKIIKQTAQSTLKIIQFSTIFVIAGFIFLCGAGKVEAAIGYDAGSESHTGTTASDNETSFLWTHTPAGTPRGVLVFVFTNDSVDNTSSVTYGGVTMTEVSGGLAVDTAGEKSRIETFFLGSSVPTGAQTV